MSARNAILGAAMALGIAAMPMISSARAFIDIDVAPPAPREEVVPAPRAGYVWAPGYWNWSGHEHAWVGGHWIAEHKGHHYVAEHWEQRGQKWHFEQGRWD